MTRTARKIVGEELLLQLCEAVGVEAGETRRIVIDVQAPNVVMIYTEGFGTERLLSYDWLGMLNADKGIGE